MLLTHSNVAEVCKALRLEAGLTAEQLVSQMKKIDPTCRYYECYIYRIESGNVVPSIAKFALIAAACKSKILLKKGK